MKVHASPAARQLLHDLQAAAYRQTTLKPMTVEDFREHATNFVARARSWLPSEDFNDFQEYFARVYANTDDLPTSFESPAYYRRLQRHVVAIETQLRSLGVPAPLRPL